MNRIKIYFLETRPRFLLLSAVLVLLGAAVARGHGGVNPWHALLCLIGLLLLHSSTNVLNDYFDYTSGIDLRTQRTPFSGGSGVINSGAMTPQQAGRFGVVCFLLAVPIGGYFVLSLGFKLLPLFLAGAFFVLLGTSHLFKAGFALAEIVAGLGLGTLPVLGVAWILQGSLDPQTLFACVPSGFLVFNLLLLNEFPDVEADKSGGRKTLAVVLGLDRAAFVYLVLTALTYVWILAGALFGIMPRLALLSFLTLPLAIRAVKGSRAHGSPQKLVSALGANIVVVLGTQFLLALSWLFQD